MTKLPTRTVPITTEKLFEANIPERCWTLDIDEYAGSAMALSKTRTYTVNFEKMRRESIGLLYKGKADTYKTFLACYTLIHAIAHGHSAYYIGMPELIDRVLSNDMKAVDFKNPDLMVIDNLNTESNSFWITALSRTLCYRKDAGKPIILCTRLDDAQLASTYGDENVKMISGMCETVVTHFDEGERERRKAKRRNLFIEEV